MNYDLLEYILDVSRRMAETRTLTPLLNYVMDKAIQLVGAERGYVVLVLPDGALDIRIRRGSNGEMLAQAQDQISKSVLNEVVRTGKPIVLRDAQTDPRFGEADSVVILGLRSVMCVPLISKGETIGAIYVENRSIRGRFSEDDLTPLIVFANQAAVAIENAALNEDLEARVADRTRELEQARQQLEKSWADAIESNRLRIVWLNKIAHDLRAPLGIVSGALSMLQEGMLGKLSGEQQEWIDKSLEMVEHISRLTRDLFDLSTMEVRGISLRPEKVELDSFLQNVYEFSQGMPWPETVTLKLEITPPLPKVWLDPLRIRQVLLNLISNAQKFTAAGTVTIYAQVQAGEKEVLVGVADTGPGIPPEKLELVFDRFQQIERYPRQPQVGAGLGLAICRELVEMHGGKIWVESTVGRGSNFMFTIPLNSAVVPSEHSR